MKWFYFIVGIILLTALFMINGCRIIEHYPTACESDSDCIYVSGLGHFKMDGKKVDLFSAECINKEFTNSTTYKDMREIPYMPCQCPERRILGKRFCKLNSSILTADYCESFELDEDQLVGCYQRVVASKHDPEVCARIPRTRTSTAELGEINTRDNCYDNLATHFSNEEDFDRAFEMCEMIEFESVYVSRQRCESKVFGYRKDHYTYNNCSVDEDCKVVRYYRGDDTSPSLKCVSNVELHKEFLTKAEKVSYRDYTVIEEPEIPCVCEVPVCVPASLVS